MKVRELPIGTLRLMKNGLREDIFIKTLNGGGEFKTWQVQYRYLAEKAVGHRLPSGAQVHHWNYNHLDNRSCNLVICHDIHYHALIAKKYRDAKLPIVKVGRFCVRCREDKPIESFLLDLNVVAPVCYPCQYELYGNRPLWKHQYFVHTVSRQFEKFMTSNGFDIENMAAIHFDSKGHPRLSAV